MKRFCCFVGLFRLPGLGESLGGNWLYFVRIVSNLSSDPIVDKFWQLGSHKECLGPTHFAIASLVYPHQIVTNSGLLVLPHRLLVEGAT